MGITKPMKIFFVAGAAGLLLLIIIIATTSGGGGGTSPPANTSPQDKLTSDVTDALGPSNRNVPRGDVRYTDTHDLDVNFAINDNFSASYIKGGAGMDIAKVIKVAKSSPVPVDQITFSGTFAVQDKYGKVTEEKVLGANYSAGTISKMNLDNLSYDQTLAAADYLYWSPVMDK